MTETESPLEAEEVPQPPLAEAATADETTADEETMDETSANKDAQKSKMKKIAIVGGVLLAVLIAAILVVNNVIAPKMEAKKQFDQAQATLAEYSEGALDPSDAEVAILNLRESGAYEHLGQSEKALVDNVSSDIEKNESDYGLYLACKKNYMIAISNEMMSLGTEEAQSSTMSPFAAAQSQVSPNSRYYKPISEMDADLQSKFASATESYKAYQERKAAEAEAKEKAAAEKRAAEAAEAEARKDHVLVEQDGKTMWEVTMASNTFSISGDFDGSGNFIVTLLDSNQDLHSLIANEIGSYRLKKSVSVTKGKKYYLIVECSRGYWNLQWTGTYGS